MRKHTKADRCRHHKMLSTDRSWQQQVKGKDLWRFYGQNSTSLLSIYLPRSRCTCHCSQPGLTSRWHLGLGCGVVNNWTAAESLDTTDPDLRINYYSERWEGKSMWVCISSIRVNMGWKICDSEALSPKDWDSNCGCSSTEYSKRKVNKNWIGIIWIDIYRTTCW